MNAVVKIENKDVTMTSLEIVEFINKEREVAFANGEATKYVELSHADFLKKVVKTLGEEAAGKFSGSYIGKDSTTRPMYIFHKREATLMAMSYSPKISAAVYDRMTAMEEKLKEVLLAQPSLPNFANPAEAARAWALEYEARQALEVVVQEKEEVIAIAAPKVDFYQNYMDTDTVERIRDVAVNLNAHRDKMTGFMLMKGWIYKSGSGKIRAYSAHTKSGTGYVSQKFTVVRDVQQEQVFITKKGVDYLAKHLPDEAFKKGGRGA